MKCPKCEYLGFETGDRCRNCGYDFSLMTSPDDLPDLDLQLRDEPPPGDIWLNDVDADLSAAAPVGRTVTPNFDADIAAIFSEAAPPAREPFIEQAVAVPAAAAPVPVAAAPAAPVTAARFTPSSLPLFTGAADDDAPLIRLPAAPRTPLSVRRTPENPRLRSLSKAVRKEPEPELQFDDAALQDLEMPPVPAADRSRRSGAGSPVARIVAAAIDHAILGAIDVTVLYFTLKIAVLSLEQWPLIPVVPMLAFLLLLKLFYFAAFTAVGGQTIGMMASGIRVIADDGSGLDVAHAIRRSAVGLLSLLTLGAGFLPAVFGDDRRAIHDRVAGTRVVIA